MRIGYIICGIAYDAAHLVAAQERLPPSSVTTTDWSFFPKTNRLKLLNDATYFLLRIPGNSRGLYRALEEMSDIAGVYREGFTGLRNHRLLLDAASKIRCGATKRVLVEFWLSPERVRERETEVFQELEEDWWRGHLMCLEDPGCAEVARQSFQTRAC